MQLVINSKFRPFSYDELIKPLMQYKEAYDKVEADYSNLAAQAEQWKDVANQTQSPEAYAKYSKYVNDLNNIVDDFSKGMTPQNRSQLFAMTRRYASDIKPIENAANRRKELADEQRKINVQDPTRIWQHKVSEMSLDEFIKNPSADYGQSISGATLTAQAAQAAGALSKEMIDNPRKWRSILGNSYYETIMQKGFSSNAVLQAIQNNPNAAPELLKIVEDTVNSSGIRNWGDKTAIDRAYNYARQGLWSAVGETQYQNLDNWRAKMAEQEAMQVRAEKRAATKKVEEQRQAELNNLAINPLNIYSSKELSKDEEEYKDTIKAYSKYFYKENGQWKMNRAGWEEYNRKNLTPDGLTRLSNGATVLSVSTFHTPFRQFMDSIGAAKVTGGNWQPGNFGNVWSRYAVSSPSAKTAKYDATRVTEYDYPIAGAQQGDMKDAIMTAGRGLSLKEVDYDSKSKKFKDTGEEITMEDLKSDKYKVTSTRFSPYGTTVMIQDDKGNVRRFKMPAGINTTNEQNRDRAMAAANQWQQVVNTGQYTDARGNVHQATPDEITYAQQQYAQAIQQAYLFHSQLGVQNKTKEQEFNPYGY